MLLSIVVPVYNEAEGIRAFHKKHLLPSLSKLAMDHEIIYVNDGSNDTTLDTITGFAAKDQFIRVVSLSRNFGKEIATTAGISVAVGDAVLVMDGDGQHPPSLINEFVEKWHNGAQVVVGVRNANQKEGFVKQLGSKVFYKIFNSTAGTELVPRSTDFRLIDKVVQKEFLRFTERQRITRGLIDWLGFKRDYVTFESPARIAGKASYKTSQLVKLALNSFVSLSLKPLFFFGWVGIAITVLSIGVGLFALVEQVILGDPMNLGFTGSGLLGILISFLIGLVLISQAVLAIYVSHIHGQTQDRPLFVIDETNSRNLT